MAFNLDVSENLNMRYAGEKVEELQQPAIPTVVKSEYAYLMEWHDYYSPKALNKILNKGLRARVTMQPLEAGEKSFDYGTIMIPVQNQELDSDQMFEFLQEVSKNSNVEITPVTTGWTKGVNLGSNQLRPLKAQKVAMIVGDGVTPYDAGEIWHLFDQRYEMALTKLDIRNLSGADLSKYTDIILPNTRGNALDKSQTEKLRDWVRTGGTLIGYKNAARWFSSNDFMKLEFLEN